MKKAFLLTLILLPLVHYAQTNQDSIKQKLIGKWVIQTMLINGEKNPDFNPKLQDYLLLNQNMTFISTDKQYNYDQRGSWKLINNRYIELIDLETKESQKLEITLLKDKSLKVRIQDDGDKIEMSYSKE